MTSAPLGSRGTCSAYCASRWRRARRALAMQAGQMRLLKCCTALVWPHRWRTMLPAGASTLGGGAPLGGAPLGADGAGRVGAWACCLACLDRSRCCLNALLMVSSNVAVKSCASAGLGQSVRAAPGLVRTLTAAGASQPRQLQ